MAIVRPIKSVLLSCTILLAAQSLAQEDVPGVKGQYFDAVSSTPRVTRLDDQIDFNWGFGSPDFRLPRDNFSARWTGKLHAPASAFYTLFLSSDDGARLYIDERLVIDRWNALWAGESSATVFLSADRPHALALQYHENYGMARVTLSWSSPTMSRRVISRQQLSVPAAPTQPTAGPGSSDLRHAGVKESVFVPSLDLEYHLFEPQMPALDHAPVVIFLHGWGGLQPTANRAWIDHIVRRGNVVIWPRYQAGLLTPPALFTPHAIASVKLALAQLQNDYPARPRPDLTRVAAVGHSMGGILAANLAALAATSELPPLRAIMAVTPGTGDHDEVIAELSAIPRGTLMLSLAASDDTDRWSTLLMRSAINVAPEDRNHISVQTDDYGWPTLVADHFSPLAASAAEADALDWYGYWKWFDALSDAAFFGINRNYALGGTAEQTNMGSWSDSMPVKKAVVLDGTHFIDAPVAPSSGLPPARSAGSMH